MNQNEIIWGGGWYAIYDKKNNYWWVAPIDFFDKHQHCPDGWDWDMPAGMSEEEFEDFIDENGCEPNAPSGFSYCMEACIKCNTEMIYEYQEQAFTDAGFTIKEFKF